MLNFILGLAFFKWPHLPIAPDLSGLSWAPGLSFYPTFSIPQGNLRMSNQARNQKVWAFPATQSYSGAHCHGVNGIVLDELGEALCYSVTNMTRSPSQIEDQHLNKTLQGHSYPQLLLKQQLNNNYSR